MAIMQGNYAPEDSGITVAAVRYLFTPAGAELRAAARGAEAAGILRLEQLRKVHPIDAIHAALVMARLQDKAASKFPAEADTANSVAVPRGDASDQYKGRSALSWFWTTPEALEQASSLAVARYKAKKMGDGAAETGRRGYILDLCSGIGGDALGLAEAGPVVAAELSAVRAVCARQNAWARPGRHSISIVQTDVTMFPFASPVGARTPAPLREATLFHLDPARRAAGKRSHDYADLIPPPTFIERVIGAFPAGGAIKLSPGVDFATLPAGHLEVISERGTAVQAVLWTGRLGAMFGGNGQRTATLVGGEQSGDISTPWSITGIAESSGWRPTVEPQEYLFEVDAAVHRAGLAGVLADRLSLEAVNVDGGYLTGPPIAVPALQTFHHLATIAYSEKRVVAALRSLGPVAPRGPVEVKTRGGLGLQTDALQRAWSKVTDRAVTILVYRAMTGIRATLAVREGRFSGIRFYPPI